MILFLNVFKKIQTNTLLLHNQITLNDTHVHIRCNQNVSTTNPNDIMYINPLNVLSMRNIIIDNVNTTKSKYVIFKQFNDTNLSNPFRKLTQMKHSSYSKNTCLYVFWYHATLIVHSLSLKYINFAKFK